MLLIHILAAVTALLVGTAVLVLRKGTASHKLLGRSWVGLMLVATLSSFFLWELRRGAGPSLVHLLSIATLASLACAIYFIRRGNVRRHRGFMIGTFAGLIAAGLAAFTGPGRALHIFFFA
jgi:uncharacterized membrane protein